MTAKKRAAKKPAAKKPAAKKSPVLVVPEQPAAQPKQRNAPKRRPRVRKAPSKGAPREINRIDPKKALKTGFMRGYEARMKAAKKGTK